MAKKYVKQGVESDVSDVSGALAHVAKVTSPKGKTISKLATNDPKTVQGYEKLGPGGPSHTGKALSEKSKDNRGEGSM